MKRLAALIACITLLSTNVYADINMNYVTDGMVTTASNYSLAGSSDPEHPLYINGEQVETPPPGLFQLLRPS